MSVAKVQSHGKEGERRRKVCGLYLKMILKGKVNRIALNRREA
jgi:hypothetical protein